MSVKKTTGSIACKLCRRTGKKLFLKGSRCLGTKCAIIKRNYPPGVHGPKGTGRLTPFGLQLREKQKAKLLYGLMETPFRNYFHHAIAKEGDTGTIFLSFLERRLDSVVFRLGFAASRRHARQLVSHGHFQVNGRRVDIPSYQVKAGDEITVRSNVRDVAFFKDIASSDTRENIPSWLSVDRKNLIGKVLSLPPETDLISTEFDIKNIVEFYSK